MKKIALAIVFGGLLFSIMPQKVEAVERNAISIKKADEVRGAKYRRPGLSAFRRHLQNNDEKKVTTTEQKLRSTTGTVRRSTFTYRHGGSNRYKKAEKRNTPYGSSRYYRLRR